MNSEKSANKVAGIKNLKMKYKMNEKSDLFTSVMLSVNCCLPRSIFGVP